MPVVGAVILPLCTVAVGMSAACCGDRCGFKNLLADGAFLMLSAVGGFGSCRVNDPLAGAVSRNIGLVAALALMPVIGVVILPIRAVAVGMAGRRILIGGLNLHIITGHGEGGGGLGGVCQGDIALQHDPLVKDLACLRCVRRNGHNGVLLDLVGDGGASGNGGRALDNRERIRLYGGFGELRLDRYIVCGRGEGGGGAGLVSQCNAARLNDPLDEVLSVRSLCRNGDLNALHGAGDGCASGNGCRTAGDGNGVIPQGGDLGVLAALGAANGAFLVLDAGGILGSGLVDHPLEAVCCRVGLVAALALMPVIGVVILPIRAVAVGMRAACCLVSHDDGLIRIHCNVQNIGKHGRCSAVYGDRVDLIARVGSKDDRFGRACCKSCLARGDRSVTAVYLCRKAIGRNGCVLIACRKRNIVCGHGEGGDGACSIGKSHAAGLHDPLVKDLAIGNYRRDGDLNARSGGGNGIPRCRRRTACDGNCILGRSGILHKLPLAAAGALAGVENSIALALFCRFAAVPIMAELIDNMTVAENLSTASCTLIVTAIACGGASGLNLIDQLVVAGNFVEGRGSGALL